MPKRALRDIEKGLRNEKLEYPDSAEEIRRNLEQSSSALDLPIYAQSSVSTANVGNKSETASESGEKIREQRVEVDGKPVRFFRTKSGEAYGFTVGAKFTLIRGLRLPRLRFMSMLTFGQRLFARATPRSGEMWWS